MTAINFTPACAEDIQDKLTKIIDTNRFIFADHAWIKTKLLELFYKNYRYSLKLPFIFMDRFSLNFCLTYLLNHRNQSELVESIIKGTYFPPIKQIDTSVLILLNATPTILKNFFKHSPTIQRVLFEIDDEEKLTLLAKLAHLSHITELELSIKKQETLLVKLVELLKHFTQLTQLEIKLNEIHNLVSLTEPSISQHLQHLRIIFTNSQFPLLELSSLNKCLKLGILELNGISIDFDNWELPKGLTILTLSDNRYLKFDALKLMHQLKGSTHLESNRESFIHSYFYRYLTQTGTASKH